MRRGVALSLALVINVEGFLPAPAVNSFTGRSVSYGSRLSNARTWSAAMQRRSTETMVADGGKVLVSGFLNSKERTDQFVFDILQAQGKWEKIVAFSDNMVFAKKRLVSRKSRYSGLLDVLEFVEGDKYDAATMEEKLQDVSAWLCFDCEADKIKDSVDFAKKAGVKSMVISSTVSAADAASAGVEDALKESGLEYTFIRIGEIVEGKEGGSVMVGNVTDELPVEQVVRDDIIRLSAEAFVMENTTKTAFAFGKGDDMALEYLKELRQNGTDRRDEMSILINGGFRDYQANKEAEEAERNKPPPTEEELEERERLFQESREVEYAAMRAENAKIREQDLEKKAEKEAKEFLEREWNAQYWSRTTMMTEEEFYEDEDNKERALEHGWEVVNEDRGISKTAAVEEDDDDDDDEDEDDDDDEDMVAEGEDEEDGDEEDDEDSSETDATGGGTDTTAAGKSKKVASKTEADVAKDITAEAKDDESDGTDAPPQAKLD